MTESLVAYWVAAIVGPVVIYTIGTTLYNIYFHPAAKYPGPKLAAVSNLWYTYHWITGKYPQVIAKTLEEYGDIVRIAPNELVFIKPKAATDMYAPQTRGLEFFPKAPFITLGWPDQGITWETDPVKHHQKVKWLLPAFSAKALKEKEHILHKYVDLFVQKMRENGNNKEGVELRQWADWLAMDMAADLAYNREMKQIEEEKSSMYLESIWAANFFVTMHTNAKKYPLLGWLQYFSVPPSVIGKYIRALGDNRKAFTQRIENRGSTKHPDHFDKLLPEDAPVPAKAELQSLETICLHLMIAGYEPISSSFLCTIALCLQDPISYRRLVKEIRDACRTYDDITDEALVPLKFLHATIMEQLRIAVIGATGSPRVSPGAEVDGHYIPKGVEVQYGKYAFTRNSRYFHDPYNFRPQRWLPQDHPYWESAYAEDATSEFRPWSVGVRGCIGKPLSIMQIRLMVAKVIWAFDLELLSGGINYERDFRMYGMLVKPDVWVRFRPAVANSNIETAPRV